MEQISSSYIDSSSLSDSTNKQNSNLSLFNSNQKSYYKKSLLNQHNNNNNCNNISKKEENSIFSNNINNNASNIIDSPLFQAIFMQNINLIIDLLDKGENPNISLIDGMTPLHLAINKKNEIIIEYLLKNNANPNSKIIVNGQTPVHFAVINNCNKKILKLLVEYGGSFNIEDNNKKTALDYINNIGIYDYITILISKNKKQKENNDYSSENLKTENDIIINNNTIYTDSSLKKEINYDKLNKEYFNKYIDLNNIKRDLLESFENSLKIKKDYTKIRNIRTNDKKKENIDPNFNQEESSILSNKKKKINCIKKNYKKNKKKPNKLEKRTRNSKLSKFIQNNNNSSLYNDKNLSNITKIYNKPKIIFDSTFNLNNDIKHQKSKSINNYIFIKKYNIRDRETIKMNKNKKIFDNNDIKRLIKNEENNSLIENYNNYINNDKKRKSIPTIKKNYTKKDTIISNLSKINQKEEFSLSKIEINDENFSLYINENNNNNDSILRINKKGIIDKSLTHNANARINKLNINNKYPIYYWLKNINLSYYYNMFLENNIFDFDELIINLKKGDFSLTKEDIEKIGIFKPGHIYRIIIKLEIDSGKIGKDISNLLTKNDNYNLFFNSTEEINDSEYYCIGCCKQNYKRHLYSNIGDQFLELESWLNRIGLIKYRSNFIYNGFDIFCYFILQMFSSIPIDENIIKEELGIQDENDIDIILLQLNKDVKYILSKIKSKEKKNKKNGYIKCNETYIKIK